MALWRSVRSLPEFWRLLELRTVSQFGDGLFQAGLAGGLLFSTDRAAGPWELAGSFADLVRIAGTLHLLVGRRGACRCRPLNGDPDHIPTTDPTTSDTLVQ